MTQKKLRENARHAQLKEQWMAFMHADKMRCCVCGYNHCFAALDYHHNNPDKKDFSISTFMQRAFNDSNKTILLKELGKCICLCKNCHAELHVNIKILKQQESIQQRC